MENDDPRKTGVDSLEHPKLDFKSLQAAVDCVRYDGTQRDASWSGELHASNTALRRDPFRARHPNFRWRLIPAVYCAFYGVMCIGGLVTFDVAGNAAFAGFRGAAIALAHSFLFSLAAFCWFKNYWKCGVLSFVAVLVLNRLLFG